MIEQLLAAIAAKSCSERIVAFLFFSKNQKATISFSLLL
jgi:hypothetical protein